MFGYGPGTPSQMFYYTAFDRLNSTLVSGVATHFNVNPEGQRLRKYTSTANTYFAPDIGGKLLAEDINGTWTDYVWLNGRLMEVIANGQVYSLHDDQTGRPQVMTEPNGTSIDWAAQNKPFDRTVTTNAWGPFNIGFPGQYYDSEDDLWYNGHRDYDSTLDRYLQPDPLGLSGGINPYVYASANPISNVDPSGLDVFVASTDGVHGLHQKIVVGQIGGQLYGQSFGLPTGNEPWQSTSSAVAPTPGGKGSGVVYTDDETQDPTTGIYYPYYLKTTPAEDAIATAYLQGQVGNTGPYNPATDSCRDYSQAQYWAVFMLIMHSRN